MNKLLAAVVLIAVFSYGAASDEVLAEDPEAGAGSVGMMTNAFKSFYSYTLNKTTELVDNIKELQLDEKAKKLYHETTNALKTYSGIAQDQIYHYFSS